MGRKAWRHSVAIADWAFAAAIVATALHEIWVGPIFDDGIPGPRIANTLLFILVGLALAGRRWVPTVTLGVVMGAVLAQLLLAGLDSQAPLQSFLAVLLAFYTVAAHARLRRAVAAGVVGFAALATLDVVKLVGGANPGDVVPSWLFVGAAWAMGYTLHRRRLHSARLEDRAAVLERDREERARAAVTEERSRIARELHDVVAHGVSVMVVQAQAVQRLVDGAQPEARKGLEVIEATGRQALVELRQMLGILRGGDEPLVLAPQPGLDAVEDLAAQFRASGLPVELRIEGDGQDARLPPGADLSAYRIVQEALTNTLRHAGPARAVVTIRYRRSEVEIEIADDGAGAGDAPGVGHGIIGMRERANVYGGSLTSGSHPSAGFVVMARLPLGSASASRPGVAG